MGFDHKTFEGFKEESHSESDTTAERSMDSTRNAWIQGCDFTCFDIGPVGLAEISRIWGPRWAQKCIRDTAEHVALARFSPFPRKKTESFCPPQLGFDHGTAALAISPWVDVRPAILYGAPLQNFTHWSIVLRVRKGYKLFGLFSVDYRFEKMVSQEEALELIQLFFQYEPAQLVEHARQWCETINERHRFRLVNAFFM